jgi:D-alanyl-D-alanine-carboxypeptidase/D-alanyl-D-alanine-endopeptidase
MIRLLGGQAAVFPPETEWKYSNIALAVAGEVVAAVAREPYEEYVRAHILEPLGDAGHASCIPPRRHPALAVG